MPFRSSKGQDPSVQNLTRTQGSSNIGKNIGEGAGGGGGTFTATGGTESTPGDGYKYHVFEAAQPASASIFEVTSGSKNVEVMLQGGGGGGGSGQGLGTGVPTGVGLGGVGGSGGATGVWNITNLTSGIHIFSVGEGGAAATAGGDTQFITSDSSRITSTGGNTSDTTNTATGFAGGTTATPVIDEVTVGTSGKTATPISGGTGSPAAGIPQPTSLWWRPYIGPGAGGAGGTTGSRNGKDGALYGSGGGGGCGATPGGGNGARAGGGGRNGRAVIRYLV